MLKDKWFYLSRLKRAKNRLNVFKALDKPMMPSEIMVKVFGKSSHTNFTFVSRALAELQKEGLVELKNPQEKTGRIYELTVLGRKIQKEVKGL